ncbi:MAG: hypothetical protein PUP91_19425 [Rhizonema sp. PD37]|nr:hypothetical protein [Rhizonema sp. PD37]
MKTMWRSLELRGAIAELQNKESVAAARTLKSSGYSIAEPGSSNAAIALNFLVTSKLVPESIIVELIRAIRNSEDVLAEELAKVFNTEEDQE